MTARSDLPTTPDDLTGLLAHTAEMLTRYSTAILVAYAVDQEQASETVRQIAQRVGPARIITGIIAARPPLLRRPTSEGSTGSIAAHNSSVNTQHASRHDQRRHRPDTSGDTP